ncbi:uncharacterized protein LOC141720363 isoform X5 [Apium graveolens]|uniref:uncharacterized protein LOC141720363 isoform X5 n=1 Tax=Apium graveolens TaxID=4045 RepID=UPI003D78F80F
MARVLYRQVSLLIFGLIAGLLSQNLVFPVMSAATLEDQKTYYSPDPHGGKSHHGDKKEHEIQEQIMSNYRDIHPFPGKELRDYSSAWLSLTLVIWFGDEIIMY